MARQRAKPPVKGFNLFVCQLCSESEAMEVADFKAHREQLHGEIDHRGRQRMVMHLDATDWFESRYEWLAPDSDDVVVAVQTIRQPRRGLSKVMWS